MNDLLLEMTIRALGGDARISGRGSDVPNMPKKTHVTLEDIEANIVEEWYFTAWDGAQLAYWGSSDPANPKPEEGQPDRDGPLGRLTFCVLVLKNGFTVTGEVAFPSVVEVDPAFARNLAREAAIERVWPLMGYALAEKLRGG
jgi:hypothetical protein